MSRILVTGAAGNVGSRLVHRLAQSNTPVRALVRLSEQRTFEAGVEVVRGDLNDREQVRAAMKGVDKVYLLTAGLGLPQMERVVIQAAASEKVSLLVKHSVQGAPYEAAMIPAWHRASEKEIEASGLPYTFLRPASFASNALGWGSMLKGGDTVYGPYGDVALPVIDPEDIAAVAHKVLTEDGHAGKAYELTGPASLTTAEQVAVLGRVLNRPLHYVNVPDSAALDSMVAMGMPKAYAEAMIDLVKMLRGLGKVPTTGAVAEVLKRPATSFEDFIRANTNVFR